jgi:hypothetical protein
MQAHNAAAASWQGCSRRRNCLPATDSVALEHGSSAHCQPVLLLLLLRLLLCLLLPTACRRCCSCIL